MMRKIPPIVFVLLLFISAISVLPLSAAIKPMTLPEMMEISTGAIDGQITAKESVVIFDPADNMNEIWTRLTVSGTELTTGETVTHDLYYMGGVWNGQRIFPVTSPRDYQTRVGARVVAFYWFDPSLSETGANKIFCYPNIYQVQQGSSEPTVIGLGDGAAVPYNTKLSVLSAEVKRIYAEQKINRGDR